MRRDALAGAGRRADEEAELGLADSQNGLGLRDGGAEEHKDNDRGGNCRGRHRVHGDAQLAMIGVGIAGVQVRDLGYGQKRQQEQAHGDDNPHQADGASPSEPLHPESWQTATSLFLF